MSSSIALQGINRLFLDTSPIVYYVEENTNYVAAVEGIFDQLDTGALTGVISAVTLAECLVMPLRQDRQELKQAFLDLLLHSDSLIFISLDDNVAIQAADLRARYNLPLADAFQAAAALVAGCDAFLTNDVMLKRVVELNVIVLGEFSAE